MSIKIEINIMEWIRRLYTFLKYKVNIWHILLLSLAIHFLVIATPSIRLKPEEELIKLVNEGKIPLGSPYYYFGEAFDGLVFDEAHYVPAAFKTLDLQAANIEHPPLTKIFIALSIAVFGGVNSGEYILSFAVRLPIVIASVVSIYFVYLIAKRYLPERYALLSAVFLTFDIFFFVHGSLAILDMPEILFALMAIYLFLNKKYEWSAFFFGVSFLCLERVLFFMFGIFIFALLNALPRLVKSQQKLLEAKSLGKVATVFVLIFLAVTLGGLYIYEIIYKPATESMSDVVVYVDEYGVPWTTITETVPAGFISNPLHHLMFMWDYYSVLAPSIEPKPEDYRPPWGWTLPAVNMWNPPGYIMIGYVTETGEFESISKQWVSMISYPIAYMFWPMYSLCIYNLFKKRETAFSKFFIALTSGTYIPWLFFGAFVQRMTFNYYFLVTTPFLAMGVPYFWSQIPLNRRYRNVCILVHLALTVVFFIYYFPWVTHPA
ncbi:MAG: glycosyltransferase family 39 protein [Candidatus Bathyarchaeia archaeon]